MTFVPLQKGWNRKKLITFDEKEFNCELTFEGYFKSTKEIKNGDEIKVKQPTPKITQNDFINYDNGELLLVTENEVKNEILVSKQDIENGELFELKGVLKDADEDDNPFTIYKKVA